MKSRQRLIGVALALASSALVAPPLAFAQTGPGSLGLAAETTYVGGRGLITDEMATGLFLNPTSGTLGRHQFTLQYCALISKDGHETAVGHRAVAAFGLTEWFELGVGGLLDDRPGPDTQPTAAGPLARLRLLKDEGGLPELSVGGIFVFGDRAVQKQSVYVAASKGLAISQTGPLWSVRGHLGFRQRFVEEGKNGSFGYVGAEAELPRHVFLVTELYNKSGGAQKTPWAVGIQVRRPDGFGFTLAAVQRGETKALSIYVGVGISFQ
jgi:hypothetical protein